MAGRRILLAGESWIMHTIHQKGFDSFNTTAYGEGHQWLSAALKDAGYGVEYLPNHLANADFPQTVDEMSAYDAIFLSDIGANTLLLHPDTFTKSVAMPNRLAGLHNYVVNGGGLVMIGGYLTFQGIDAKARYAGTAVEFALPVTMSRNDDRFETPEGATPIASSNQHAILEGLHVTWPDLLGYNRVEARPTATVLARMPNNDPLLAVWELGEGRSVAFTSDCGPHWAPPAFVEWEGYARLWGQIADWVTNN